MQFFCASAVSLTILRKEVEGLGNKNKECSSYVEIKGLVGIGAAIPLRAGRPVQDDGIGAG